MEAQDKTWAAGLGWTQELTCWGLSAVVRPAPEKTGPAAHPCPPAGPSRTSSLQGEMPRESRSLPAAGPAKGKARVHQWPCMVGMGHSPFSFFFPGIWAVQGWGDGFAHLEAAAWVAQAEAANAAVPVKSVTLWLCVKVVVTNPTALVAKMTRALCLRAAQAAVLAIHGRGAARPGTISGGASAPEKMKMATALAIVGSWR